VPPITARTLVPSLLLALAAGALGAVAYRREAKRLGVFAVLAGSLGFILAYAATETSEASLGIIVSWGSLTGAMLRFATPLSLAALGGVISERAGVVNIGLEGMMLMGAFFAALGADKTGSWVAGLAIGVLAGMALAGVHALFSVFLRADQIISGTALNFLALGITGYFFIDVYGSEGTPNDLPGVPKVALGLDNTTFLGRVVDDQSLLVWVALLLVLVVYVVLFRTAFGLRLRSVGENPKAAETVGIDVLRMRTIAVLASGAFAGLGGAALSIALAASFNQGMTAGRGFIALAAVIFGRWKPGGALAACLLFGFGSALAPRLGEVAPAEATLFQALPYVLTLAAVAGVVGLSRPPAADGVPYRREG
jgi:general nucleoside transport system permease protein